MQAIGFVLSALGAWCQMLLFATFLLAPLGAVGDPLAGAPICHATAHGATEPGRQARLRHTNGCALCAICLARVWHLAIVSPASQLPMRRSVVLVWLGQAYPRAPPVRLVEAFRPRGPPALI